MLNCEYCDYFKMLHHSLETKDKKASACEFTGFVFTRDVSEMDIEPPCSTMSYQTYLERCQNSKNEKAYENGILYTKDNENATKIGA